MELIATGVKKDFIRQGKGTNVLSAVKETDLTLAGGQLVAVTGRSGSGKSTLLNLLAGLLTPSGGNVVCGETDLYALSDEALSEFRNRHFGYIPQGQSAVSSLTVLENVLLPLTLYGEEPDVSEAEALLFRMGILGLRDVMPRELSGGELRRMAIARALIRKPEFLFADEPTGDLDDENTEIVLSILREAARNGAAVLLVTHEREAAELADVQYRMADGALSLLL